jgi:hypothetical protein
VQCDGGGACVTNDTLRRRVVDGKAEKYSVPCGDSEALPALNGGLLGLVVLPECVELSSEVTLGNFVSAVAGLQASDVGELVSVALSLIGIVRAVGWAIMEGLPVQEADVTVTDATSTDGVGADTAGVVGKAKHAAAVEMLGMDDVGARRPPIEVTTAASAAWAVAFGVSRALGVSVDEAAMMAVEAIAAVASSGAKVAVAKS